MYTLPETVYLHKSIVGYKVMGYREDHRTAHHIGHMDDVIITEPEKVWTELSNHGLPVTHSGTLYNPRKMELKLGWNRRGYIYHPDLLPLYKEIVAVYITDPQNKEFIKLQSVKVLSDGILMTKSTAPICIWDYFDYPLKADEFVKLVNDANGISSIQDGNYIAQIKLNYKVIKWEA